MPQKPAATRDPFQTFLSSNLHTENAEVRGASRIGELESFRFVALAGTDRKYPRFRIQQTQNKGGIAQVLKHFLGESHAILIQEHIRVVVDAEWSKKSYDLIVPYITVDWQ